MFVYFMKHFGAIIELNEHLRKYRGHKWLSIEYNKTKLIYSESCLNTDKSARQYEGFLCYSLK